MYHASSIRPRYQPAMPLMDMPDDEPIGLRPIDFSTSEVSASDRFDAWRNVHSVAFDLSPGRDSSNFRARHRTWDLGSMAFQTIETDSVGFASLAEQSRRDPLDHWVVSLFVTGRCTIEGCGVLLENIVGIPQLTSLADPFHGQVTSGKAHLLYIPRDTCRDAAHLLDAASLTLLQDGLGGIFADYMLSLESRMSQLQPDDLTDLVAATRALLLAAIAPSPDRLEEAGAMINHARLERARQCVQDNLQNPALDVNFILRNLGVSRSRLYRLFEASGGIMHYIQKRRLLAAHKVLADPLGGRRIFEVAEDFCFNDAAEFSRAFRREFSYSPSDVRAHRPLVVLDRAGSSPHAKDLTDLLKRMQR